MMGGMTNFNDSVYTNQFILMTCSFRPFPKMAAEWFSHLRRLVTAAAFTEHRQWHSGSSWRNIIINKEKMLFTSHTDLFISLHNAFICRTAVPAVQDTVTTRGRN